MHIRERLGSGELCFSFEFFPPRTDKGVESLFQTVTELQPLEPGFVSVTYPGSATPAPDADTARRRELTLALTRRIREESGIEAMAHITCSAHTREELARILDRLAAERADNVLALRGDPPGESGFVVAEGGFAHAVQLIELVREQGHGFSVGGACYPEKHQECVDLDLDIKHLKAKVDAGADFLISQLFFDNRHWFAFLEKSRAAGIDVPIVPGLMPITSRDGIVRMTQLSGASIPDGLRRELDAHADDEDAIIEIGISHTTAQAIELLESGAPGIHFYTLNKSRATRAILGAIRRRLM